MSMILSATPTSLVAEDDYRKFLAGKFRDVPPSGFACEPTTSGLFPFQRDLVRWAVARGCAAIFADTGLGKAQPVDEVVLTPGGWRPIGDIEIGDSVIGSNGKSTAVIGVFPQGIRRVYRVLFSDGAECSADGEHLWSVCTDLNVSRGDGWRVMTTNAIAADLRAPDGRARWRVPLVTVDQADAELPLDPYVLGILIGDGYITGQATVPAFTTADQEIVAMIDRRLPAGFRCTRISSRSSTHTPTYGISRKAGIGVGSSRSAVIHALQKVGLWGCDSFTKFIPQIYLTASASQRADLLRGLMDSDGWTGSATQFTTSNERLALDVCGLVRSLGGTSFLSSKSPTYSYKGEKRTGATAYAVTLKVPFVPFALERKKQAYESVPRVPPSRKIIEIIDAGEAECVCIKVAAEDQLYVTRDYVVTHNSRMQVEWAKIVWGCTGSRVLILAPLAVAAQTVREGARMGTLVTHCRDDADVRDGINITNYDRLHRFDPRRFDSVVLDESSCIKHFTSKTLATMIDAFGRARYKLCATATPAPNDYAELGTHAEFLGVCSRSEMLAEYFVHDSGETQKWRLKGHAQREFWAWVACWAALVRRPSDLGYEDDRYALPELKVIHHAVEAGPDDAAAAGVPFIEAARTLTERRWARRASAQKRIAACAELTRAEPHEQWLVWGDYNIETEGCARIIDGAEEVRGPDDPDDKERLLLAFADGSLRALVSKPSIAGWGMNFQKCARMAFVGIGDSFEAYYQAVRRSWRFGQDRSVEAHIFSSKAEGAVVENLRRKEEDARRMAEELSAHTRDAVKENVTRRLRRHNVYAPERAMVVPHFMTGGR